MEYRYLLTNSQLEAFTDELKRRPGATVAVDSETNGLDPLAPGAALHLLQVGLEGEAPAVINAHKTNLEIIRPVLEDGRLCILQNAKFDLRWLAATRGIQPRRIYDTMLGEQLLNAGRFDSLRERRSACSLKNLAAKYCALSLDKEIRMGFVRAKGPEFSQELLEYAAHDIPCLFPIRRAQTEELVKAGMLDTAKLEFSTVVVVAAMELAGIGIDERQYHGLIEANTREMAAAEAAVLELLRGWGWQTNLLGEVDINLGSVPQLRRAFRHEGHPTESTDDDALKVLEARGSELAARLRVYRDWSKQVQAFGENVLALIHPRDLRLHPEFDQLGSDAGRFSCKGPNLQQMPREARYRRCFVPAPGNKLVVADYSAFEMRILAQLSQDRSLIETFELGRDMHTDTASRMFDIPYDAVDKKGPERQAAKSIGFGLVYGMGVKSLAVTLKISESEAREKMDLFFRTRPGVKAWLGQAATDGLTKLECRSIGGRRRLMNPPESGPDYRAHCGSIQRKCQNGPIQSTNSDALKLAMCRIYRDLESRGMGPGIVFCVHDEIGLEVAEKDAEAARALLQAHMIAAGRHYLPDVPVEVEATTADYWSK